LAIASTILGHTPSWGKSCPIPSINTNSAPGKITSGPAATSRIRENGAESAGRRPAADPRLIGQVEGRGQILVVRPLPLGGEGVEIDFDQVKIDIDAGKNKSPNKSLDK